MNRCLLRFWGVICAIAVLCAYGSAQTYHAGGRFGISVASNGHESSAGLQIGPTFDVVFQKNMALGTELTVNTQNETPIEWGNVFKYFIDVPRTDISPYIDGGFNLWFVTGGPYFGLQFGGGAYFPIAPDLAVPADLQFGPIFTSGSSSFYFALTTGIRYTLPTR